MNVKDLKLIGGLDLVLQPTARLNFGDLQLFAQVCSEIEGLRHAQALADSVPRGEVLHDHNRSIGVVITNAQGAVLTGGVHQGALNKTLHAEIHAIQTYYFKCRERLPAHARVYVTLKPCLMCAGMLAHACEAPETLRIYYLENDKGPLAQRTALENQMIHWNKNY